MFDVKELKEVRRVGMPSHVAAVKWHPKINQIFVGIGEQLCSSGQCELEDLDTVTGMQTSLDMVYNGHWLFFLSATACDRKACGYTYSSCSARSACKQLHMVLAYTPMPTQHPCLLLLQATSGVGLATCCTTRPTAGEARCCQWRVRPVWPIPLTLACQLSSRPHMRYPCTEKTRGERGAGRRHAM